MTHISKNICIIIGAGLSGLVTAKELLEGGIENIVILEKGDDLGGVWRTHSWPTATLTSSKWITEFSSFPMPDDYPDFPTPEQMATYLRSFAEHFGLLHRIRCGVTVQAIQPHESDGQTTGRYNVVTNQGTYGACPFVVVCSGLHGKPKMPNIPGLDSFTGTVIHGRSYRSPDPFRYKRVVCIGLGESAVGISSEISAVAAQTIVAGTVFAAAPRVYPYTNIPIDQVSFWQVGQYMKDYQELVTVGASWYNRLPGKLRSMFVEFHPALKGFPKEWLPDAWSPYRWHAKYWPYPGGSESHASGNLTRPTAPTDDLLYLLQTRQIEAKGRVIRIEGNQVFFQDGSSTETDALVMNTGYQASVLAIDMPLDWPYRHQDLYKGCFHPHMPNLAFVGLVRPTIGSISAMAEMQARLVAQVFSKARSLPSPPQLETIIKAEAKRHARLYPTIHDTFPHVYAFEQWMEEMADILGCQPKLWQHLGSWQQLQAYLLGSPQPLRYRQHGVGAIADAKQRYGDRTTKLFDNGFGQIYRNYIFLLFAYPHVFALVVGLVLLLGFHCSGPISLGIAALIWGLYMTVDLFRFVVWMPLIILDSFIFRKAFQQRKTLKNDPLPNYDNPSIFQTHNLEGYFETVALQRFQNNSSHCGRTRIDGQRPLRRGR